MEQQSVHEEQKVERQLASYGYQPRPAAAVTMKHSPVRQQLNVRTQLNSNALSTANEQKVRLSSVSSLLRCLLAQVHVVHVVRIKGREGRTALVQGSLWHVVEGSLWDGADDCQRAPRGGSKARPGAEAH